VHCLLHKTKSFFCDHECSPQTTRIYKRLTKTFRNTTPTTEEIDHTVEAMKLIAPLSKNKISQKSYQLFHVVIHAMESLACSQEKKWEAACLTMRGAYEWDKFLLWVRDPQDILVFLDHHFELTTKGSQNQEEPIQKTLHALVCLRFYYHPGSQALQSHQTFFCLQYLLHVLGQQAIPAL